MAINEQMVLDYTKAGLSPKEIADKLSTEDEKISHQTIGAIVRKAAKAEEPLATEVITKPEIKTLSAKEYEEYSLANGRTSMGGEIGVKVKASVEDLRAKLNSGWTPSMFLEKWQLTEDEFKQMVWKLGRLELRDKEPYINFKKDIIRF